MKSQLVRMALLLFFSILVSNGASVSVCDEASLRAALIQGGVIDFACDGTIRLSSTIQINASATLRGNGHNVTISGGGAVQMFVINFGVTFTMEGLTLADGYLRGTTGFPGGPGGAADGGGILNFGLLTCNQCVFERNRAFGGIGGPAPGSPGSLPGNGGPGRGGAICIGAGQVFLTDCIFRNNQSSGGMAGAPNGSTPSNSSISGDSRGGALYAIGGGYSLTRCVFSQNQATLAPSEIQQGQSGGAGEGGAIFLDSAFLSASACVFTQNAANGGPGGPFGGRGGAARGGLARFVASNVSMGNCALELNSATGGDGGTASSFTTVTSGGPADGGAIHSNGGTLTLNDCTVVSNKAIPGYLRRFGVNYGTANATGGAIYGSARTVVKLSRCMLRDNLVRSDLVGSSSGGAIFLNGDEVTLNECELSNNQAEGGHYGPPANPMSPFPAGSGFGGAVHIESGRLFSSNSTFSANIALGAATVGESFGGNAWGGAILNRGTGVVENCTFTKNQARGGDSPNASRLGSAGNGLGGAIYNAGSVSLIHATVASNVVKSGFSTNGTGLAQGGGIYSLNATSELRAVIVAGNAISNYYGAPLIDHGYNLSSDGSCAFTDATSASNIGPVLGPLSDFGGPTPTMPLLSGSPAVDRVVSGPCPLRDQRGRVRPYGAGCDVGAFESSAPFTIRGQVSGPWMPAGIEVSNGANTTTTGVDFRYRFDGLVPAAYTITPSAIRYLSVPGSHTVAVNTDVLGVDFTAYLWNSLFAERSGPDSLKLLYAGTNGNLVRIQSTTAFTVWEDHSTNTVSADGLIQLAVPTVGPQRLFRAVIP